MIHMPYNVQVNDKITPLHRFNIYAHGQPIRKLDTTATLFELETEHGYKIACIERKSRLFD